jgi:indole-3-acetate monooxygenase
MKDVAHPSTFIKKEQTDSIRSCSGDAELLHHLHPDQLSVINKANWFNMFVPKQYGGLDRSLPEGVRIEEALSCADGSTGWVVTLCSGAAWFAGFLNQEISNNVFLNANACFAGSGAPTGTAELLGEDYKVNGYWKYASGSIHATVFTANCVLVKNGQPVLNDDQKQVIRPFLFKKTEVEVHPVWKSMGMVATGSNDFEIKDLTVSRDRCFLIDAKHALINSPLYQFPFLQLAEVTLTANLSGMAIRFLDLCGILFEDKKKQSQYSISQEQVRQEKLSEWTKNIRLSRNLFYDALEISWDALLVDKAISQQHLDFVSKYSNQLATVSRNCVDGLYPYCGLIATNTDQEINRVWRNFHTATQHTLFTGR